MEVLPELRIKNERGRVMLFKYLWIAIIAVPILIWAFASIVDLVLCIRYYGDLISAWDEVDWSSKMFFSTLVVVLFIASLIVFILGG